ncbi:MAG TPA: hypothetical protein VFF35_06865 [Bacteroidia bacterium]|nr:hypothetical protein [Bacteroidia bacterium]
MIKNIFYPTQGSSDHFLKCRILKYLYSKFINGDVNDKLEQYSKLTLEFVNLGCNVGIVQKEINELLKFGLLESENIISDTEWNQLPTEDFNVSISSKGYYYFTNLINRFSYLDLVLQDVPIFNVTSFQKLIAIFPKADAKGKRFLFDRKNVITTFINYLKEEELKQSGEMMKRYGSVVTEIEEGGLNKDFIKINELI